MITDIDPLVERSNPGNLEFNREVVNRVQVSEEPKPSKFQPDDDRKRVEKFTCPFDLVVDHYPDRIPEKIFQLICQECTSCGPFHICTQTMLPYEVYYRSTILEIRVSCVCMTLEMGSSANFLDL